MADVAIGVVGGIVAAVIGAVIGAVVGWLGIKRGDDLARHRERQLDDRRHLRERLLEEYRGQLEAERAYADALSWIRGGVDLRFARVPGDSHQTLSEVHAIILAGFDDADLANECVTFARAMCEAILPGKDSEERTARGQYADEEARLLLQALTQLRRKTAERLGMPKGEDWRPLRDAAFEREDKRLEGGMTALRARWLGKRGPFS